MGGGGVLRTIRIFHLPYVRLFGARTDVDALILFMLFNKKMEVFFINIVYFLVRIFSLSIKVCLCLDVMMS